MKYLKFEQPKNINNTSNESSLYWKYEGPVYHITIDPGENHYFSEKYVKPIKKIRREKLNKIKNEFENNWNCRISWKITLKW